MRNKTFKNLFLLLIISCVFAFAPEKKSEKKSEKKIAWAYIHLVCGHKWQEASVFFQELAQKEPPNNYAKAAEVLLRADSTNFDYYDFYQQFILPETSIFTADFLEKKKFKAEEIELGKLLFYDPVLSANGKRTCASCHRAEKAFCDQRITSKGVDFSVNLKKNSPTLLNVAYENAFFHEANAKNISAVIESVIKNPQEFNNDYGTILAKLNGSEAYKTLFFHAYKKRTWTKKLLNHSIEAFVNNLTSLESTFDQSIRDSKKQLPDNLKDGYNTFMGVGKCGTCHRPPTFGGSDNPFSTDYLTLDYEGKKLKVPALRHILQSFPYMHDGRAPTLSDVYSDVYHASFVPKSITKEQIAKINVFLTYICDNITSDNQIPKQLPLLAHRPQRNIGGLY